MSFEAGPYVPLPLSEDRSETPPPKFNHSQPFTSIELIVSGLLTNSFSAATDHLIGIVDNLRLAGARIPPLHISSPVNVQPLNFIYVSLSGPLRETPRPDILERVRKDLDSIEGLRALWKVAPGCVDKTCQAYFQIDDDLNPSDIKARIDQILQQNDHHLQGSYIQPTLTTSSTTFSMSTPSPPSPTHPSSLTTAHIILVTRVTSSPPMAWKSQSLVLENFQVFKPSSTTTLNVCSPLADPLNQSFAEAASSWTIPSIVSSLVLLRLLSASSPAETTSNPLATLQLFMTNYNTSTHSTPPASLCFSALAPMPSSLPNDPTMSFSDSWTALMPKARPPLLPSRR